VPETQNFKAKFYRVERMSKDPSERLEDIIDRVFNMEMNERSRAAGGYPVRLEEHRTQGEYVLMNFIRMRYDGPGKAREGDQLHEIPMENDEYFAYQTAALYEPGSERFVIEASRAAPGASGIASYFTQFARDAADGILLAPILDPDAAARIRRKGFIRRLEVRVALGAAGQADAKMDVDPIAVFGNDFDARFCDLTFSVGRERDRFLDRASILERLPNWLRRVDSGAVTKLKVLGKEDEDSESELIDLIGHQEKREREMSVDQTTRDIPLERRWEALIEFFREVKLE